MGYIIALIVLLLVLPLVFMMLSRRTTTAGGVRGKLREREVSVTKPSSDEPTPGGQNTVNQPAPGDERRVQDRIPPG